MLEYINIKNVALIDEAEICFGEGLNIITGETGAGKSMLIDSVNFALGGKADKSFVREGAEKAMVELCFSSENEDVRKFLLENDIPEDENILITRSLNDKGRSVNKINGVSVTVSMLKEISEGLIDIHGQHEHQSLINSDRQRQILDKFCGENFASVFRTFSEKYSRLLKVEDQLENLQSADMEQRLDFIGFQINEIESANLKEKEDEILSDRKKILQNAKKLTNSFGETIEILYDGRENVSDKLEKALSLLEDIKNIDSSLTESYEAVERASIEISETMYSLKDYFRGLDLNPDELYAVDERLNQIFVLKRKYGKTIDDIFEKLNALKKEKEEIENSRENINCLKNEQEKLIKETESLADEISDMRIKTAKNLEGKIEKELKSLEMKNAVFKIKVDRKENITSKGRDDIEFLISPNLGETEKPLAKIASGGEISRVMLALKNVLSSEDDIDTFIFDEIDTGVSGRTAQKVAEKMNSISGNKQVLCITHLPQIAAMADKHFLIEKEVEGEKTLTRVKDLDRKGSVNELARLMGGAEITEVIMNSAEEVKSQAENIKKSKA
ncbi:MAG: DNA repair protein RecN [Firmicutes bacterium]|nr:DNA repair protein RecN [Bacillota bacterium]